MFDQVRHCDGSVGTRLISIVLMSCLHWVRSVDAYSHKYISFGLLAYKWPFSEARSRLKFNLSFFSSVLDFSIPLIFVTCKTSYNACGFTKTEQKDVDKESTVPTRRPQRNEDCATITQVLNHFSWLLSSRTLSSDQLKLDGKHFRRRTTAPSFVKVHSASQKPARKNGPWLRILVGLTKTLLASDYFSLANGK